MGHSGAYGRRLADRFGLCDAPAFIARSLRKCQIAITQIRSDVPNHQPTLSIAPEDAFLVALQFRDISHHVYWEAGRQAPVTSLKVGDTTLYDLKRDPVYLMDEPFHSIHFYLPRATLDAVADEANAPRIADLEYRPGAGVDDPAMRGLTLALVPAFERPKEASRLFVEHVARAVAAHVAHRYGGMPVHPAAARGGLAPWQERRAKEIIDAKLDGEISLAFLSGQCGLSTSHFSRAFRRSTGMSPHQWLLARRVDQAKDLLRRSDLGLSEIALACGFADQSHFTRIFARATGVSPGAWRRSALG